MEETKFGVYLPKYRASYSGKLILTFVGNMK